MPSKTDLKTCSIVDSNSFIDKLSPSFPARCCSAACKILENQSSKISINLHTGAVAVVAASRLRLNEDVRRSKCLDGQGRNGSTVNSGKSAGGRGPMKIGLFADVFTTTV